MIALQKITSPAELAAVNAAAKADDHAVLAPTHMLVIEGRVVGYVSLFSLPVVHIWTDRKQVTVRDSLASLQQVEAVACDRGAKDIVTPCEPGSPYFPYLARVGFHEIGPVVLFAKPLKSHVPQL